MKKIICFIILALSLILVNANTLQKNTVVDSGQQPVLHNNIDEVVQVDEIDKPDVVSSLTLAVNAINNIQTWSAVIIAILTLAVALFGFFGYRHIENSMKENIKKNDKAVDDKIREIEQQQQAFNDCVIQTKAISEKLSGQEKYICKTNQYLYDALDKIANQISDVDTGKIILKEMLHNYQITNLYSTDNSKKFAALAYIQENGSTSDIEHLEFISNYDSNEDNKKWAREIVGIIRYRNTQ